MKASNLLLQLSKLGTQELIAIKGIGEKTAMSMQQFFESKRFDQLLSRLLELETKNRGVAVIMPVAGVSKGRVCITGQFDKPRSELETELVKWGYSVVQSVGKQTDILLAGTDAGSKLQKAEQLGVRIIHSLTELE